MNLALLYMYFFVVSKQYALHKNDKNNNNPSIMSGIFVYNEFDRVKLPNKQNMITKLCNLTLMNINYVRQIIVFETISEVVFSDLCTRTFHCCENIFFTDIFFNDIFHMCLLLFILYSEIRFKFQEFQLRAVTALYNILTGNYICIQLH